MKSIEHRKNDRQMCYVPVDGKANSLFSEVMTVDISQGGIGFVSSREIPLNEQIAVEVELGVQQESALVVGEVRWVEPVRGRREYRIGMKFVRVISPGSRSRLTEYFGSDR